MKNTLELDSITFGKYKNKHLKDLIKDRKYSLWLIEQPWFKDNYEYLYNRINEYKPLEHFLEYYNNDSDIFIDRYKFFNLKNIKNIDLDLTEDEKLCYRFYYKMIGVLKDKIKERIENLESNPYDIKAPTKWLQMFENDSKLSRDIFKNFIVSYDLPNIPNIIEDIKKEGGIDYKATKSFHIAKERSGKQEKFWENILKNKYKEYIGTQFKFENCIFDFININTNTIYECKLNLKDFNEDQYNKYVLTLGKYNIIYLISDDCIIDIKNKVILTTNYHKYYTYQLNIPLMQDPSKFDDLIIDFDIKEIKDINHNI